MARASAAAYVNASNVAVDVETLLVRVAALRADMTARGGLSAGQRQILRELEEQLRAARQTAIAVEAIAATVADREEVRHGL